MFWLLPGESSQRFGRRDSVVEGCKAGKGQCRMGNVQTSSCVSSKIPQGKIYLQPTHD